MSWSCTTNMCQGRLVASLIGPATCVVLHEYEAIPMYMKTLPYSIKIPLQTISFASAVNLASSLRGHRHGSASLGASLCLNYPRGYLSHCVGLFLPDYLVYAERCANIKNTYLHSSCCHHLSSSIQDSNQTIHAQCHNPIRHALLTPWYDLIRTGGIHQLSLLADSA